MLRTIKNIHQAIDEPMGDLSTYRALPNKDLDQIDPFLLLNHHGPQFYPPDNNGLPFGPHPHRGFETVTFILQGDVMHTDSSGGKSIIKSGGVQWMTAGSGLIHAEVSSDEFKMKGGTEEVIQIWINLPAKLKMTPPGYIGLNRDDIPSLKLDDDKGKINLVSGKINGIQGPINSWTDIFISSIEIINGGRLNLNVEPGLNILFYIVKGKVKVNNQTVPLLNLVEFNNDGEKINVEGLEDSTLIFGYAKPFNEPVVSYGPFVMNTQAEIKQAILDYQEGKMR
jgi:redox-sensitive bicupin YhaK (pirin superfamily)